MGDSMVKRGERVGWSPSTWPLVPSCRLFGRLHLSWSLLHKEVLRRAQPSRLDALRGRNDGSALQQRFGPRCGSIQPSFPQRPLLALNIESLRLDHQFTARIPKLSDNALGGLNTLVNYAGQKC